MKTKSEIKQFILDTLLPYKEDNSKCAFENKRCVYLTSDGKKCAVGKHMKEGKWQSAEGNYSHLINIYDPKDFFTEEALSYNLTENVWGYIQLYHDEISQSKLKYVGATHKNSIVSKIENLLDIELDELKF